MVNPLALSTALVKSTVPPALRVKLMTTGPGGNETKSEHCALAPTIVISVKHSTSSPCAKRRGVVEMFMVKKLVDEEKGEMPRIFEKECIGLFIKVSRFGVDRCGI